MAHQEGTVPATLGRRVFQLREELGWTQKKLADQSGISVTFLSEVENDKRMPGAEIVLRLAEVLGVSVDYLLTGRLDSRLPAQPLVIPPELQQAAEERHWSLSVAVDLLKADQLVVARRGKEGLTTTGRRSKSEWIEMHERWFGRETRK